MMKSLKGIVRETHVGYGGSIAKYPSIVKERTLTAEDIQYIERIIKDGMSSNCGYDCFPDEGGINVAAYLLEEVKKLMAVKEN